MEEITVDELRERYGCKTDLELSLLLGMTPGNMSVWRKHGIPEKYQNVYKAEANRLASQNNTQQKAPVAMS